MRKIPSLLPIGVFVILGIFAMAIFPERYIEAEDDKELGYVIKDLRLGETFTVSNATHAYLFKRLEEQKPTMVFGGQAYYLRIDKDKYVLDCPCAPADFPCVPANNEYYLEIIRRSILINPAGKSLDVLFIKKVPGPYYNE